MKILSYSVAILVILVSFSSCTLEEMQQTSKVRSAVQTSTTAKESEIGPTPIPQNQHPI